MTKRLKGKNVKLRRGNKKKKGLQKRMDGINSKIETIFSFSAILICIVYAVCETLENRKNNS